MQNMQKWLHYVIYNGLSIFIRAQKNSRIAVFNGLALEYFLSPHNQLFLAQYLDWVIETVWGDI